MPVTQKNKSNLKLHCQHEYSHTIRHAKPHKHTNRIYGRYKTSILTFITIQSLPKESRYMGRTTWKERPNLTTSNWESSNAKTPDVFRTHETNTSLQPPHSIVRSTHLNVQNKSEHNSIDTTKCLASITTREGYELTTGC